MLTAGISAINAYEGLKKLHKELDSIHAFNDIYGGQFMQM